MPEAPPADSSRLKARDAATAILCVALGVGFGALVWMRRGTEPAQQYLAGYLIELSLSADNVFVFALVFAQFGMDPRRQRGLLLWGVAGAILMRTAFIIAGIGAVERFAWVIPVFGAVVLAAAVRLALAKPGRAVVDPSGPAYRFLIRHLPKGLAALFIIEASDLVFALDSLPAVIAVTHDRAIAVASNLFAILGLRSLFFVVSSLMEKLRYLNAGVAAILGFVGAKMLMEHWIRVPTGVSLGVIGAVLALSVSASLIFGLKPPAAK